MTDETELCRTKTVEMSPELLEALLEATRENVYEERFANMVTPLMTGA